MKRWFPIWVFPIILALGVSTIWLRLYVVRTTYSITQLDRQIRNMKYEKEKMELKMAALRSPRHLEGISRGHFNLVQPKAHQIVHIK